MWSGLISVAVILIIFVVGFLFHYRRWWPESTPAGLSAVVVRISAPCLAVTSIVTGFTRELLRDSLVLLIIAALHILALLALGKLLARLLKLRDGKRTVFEVTFTYSNVIFVGLPINQIVFGEKGLPFLFAYYIVILAAFWSLGVAQIAAAGRTADGPILPVKSEGLKSERHGEKESCGESYGEKGPDSIKSHKWEYGINPDRGLRKLIARVLKTADPRVRLAKLRITSCGLASRVMKIFNPGFIGVIIGYALVEAGLKLPEALDLAMGYLGSLTVPLSLLVIGANLTIFAKGIPKITLDEIVIMLGKFVISPLIMLGLLLAFGVSGLPFFVLILSSSMPCHMQTSILAQHYDVEGGYAAKLVGLSTLLSIVTIPAYVAGIYHFM
ncbi:MAG: AEC family transporter [Clostridiales Family XIII bacterium]|jgi:predicted permease|nr:AEC family transporter [Clostridiales Family XIII bacterium]